MSAKLYRKMRKIVKQEYARELAGMCAFPFWRRVRIALTIILGVGGKT
jgi:hypothetical protein